MKRWRRNSRIFPVGRAVPSPPFVSSTSDGAVGIAEDGVSSDSAPRLPKTIKRSDRSRESISDFQLAHYNEDRRDACPTSR